MRRVQTKGVLVCVVLLFQIADGVESRALRPAKVLVASPIPEQPSLSALRLRGASLFSSGHYADAAGVYQDGYKQAVAQGEGESALKFLNSKGAALLASFQYRGAVQAFLGARRLARARNNPEMCGVVSLNLASLYLQMGDIAGASEETRAAVAALRKAPESRYRPHALAQMAKVEAREKGLDAALPFFYAAIREADAQGNVALKALVWNQIGYEFMNQRRIPEAERAMTEGFRLRVLARDRDLGQSYLALGLLKTAQRDFASASVLLDQATAAAERTPGRVPSWAVYHARGDLHMAQGRLPEAFSEFGTALELARRWRLSITPAQSAQLSTEFALEQIYSSFIRAAGELYFKTGRQRFAREAFDAAEENRAASLLAAAAQAQNGISAEYERTLGEIRAVQTQLLRASTNAGLEQIRSLRHRLSEIEARAAEKAPAAAAADKTAVRDGVSAPLRSREALIAFHMDEPHSFRWVVTSTDLKLQRLSGAAHLRKLATQFAKAVERDSDETTTLGERLYSELFGGMPARALSKRDWRLAVEDNLLGLPFPALVADRRNSHPVFLVEKHSISIVPSARMLVRSRLGTGQPNRSGPFLGVADPVYNLADSRSGGGKPQDPVLQLPRLAGTAREIRACASAWHADALPVLLEGPAATREGLREALGKGPAVIHFATHIVQSADRPPRRLISLSLLPRGVPDYLSAEEIATWRLRFPGTVVLSGCSSGAPEPRNPVYRLLAAPLAPEPAAAGLMGLARAWLIAGARDVVVSLWPTTDDTGELFRRFYGHLRATHPMRAETALARAQTEMLTSQTWRAAPRYWAAYSIIARE